VAVKTGKPERKRTPRPEPSAIRLPDRRSKTSRPPERTGRTNARATESPTRMAARTPRPRTETSQPEITLKRGPIGRETLAAIAEELANEAPTVVRPRIDTIAYEDQPKPRSSRPPQGSSPELISIGEAPIGRATQAAIEADLVNETLASTAPKASAARPSARAVLAPAEIFEISTFVVQGEEIFTKVSQQARREFVARRLLHRLPVLSMNEVVRIDASRASLPNTVILRVWTKVQSPSG
jgi:hypothetical protein